MQKIKISLILFGILLLLIPISYSISVTCGVNNVCGSGSCSCTVSDCEEGYLDIYISERSIEPVQEFDLGVGSNKYTIDASVIPRGNSLMFYKLVCVETEQNYPATQGVRGKFSVGGVGNVSGEGKCVDGTSEGVCSTNKPFLCESGKLVRDCERCGCTDGVCNENTGICEGVTKPVQTRCGDGKCEEAEYCPVDCGEEKKGTSPVVFILVVVLLVLLFIFGKRLRKKREGFGGPTEVLEGKRLVPTFKMPEIKIPKDEEKKSKALETLRKQAEALRAVKAAKGAGGEKSSGYKYPYAKDEKTGEPNFMAEGKF